MYCKGLLFVMSIVSAVAGFGATQFQTSRFELKKPQLLCAPSTLAILP